MRCAPKRKNWNEPSVCLHGDVHPKNGILLEKGIALIDLDQASVGPPAADLGSLLAALRYERHIGLLTETAERTLADTFLTGYQQIGMLPDPESLRWHMAAALFAERCIPLRQSHSAARVAMSSRTSDGCTAHTDWK